MYLWPKFLPDKIEAEVVGFHEVPNFGRGSSLNPYFYYSVLRFLLDDEEHQLILRRDKRDKLGEKVPVSYSRRYGVLLRRRWMKLYLRDKITLEVIVHFIFVEVIFGGAMALAAIISLIYIICAKEYLFETIVIGIAAVVLTAIITKINIAMEQKEFALNRSEPGDGTDVIKVYKRSVFDNKWCLYFLVGAISWIAVLFGMWAAFPELRTFGANIYWYSVIGVSLFLFCIIFYAWLQIAGKNRIIKKGKIIWATIDKTESYWENGVFFVNCIWFSKEEGEVYHFEGKYKDFSDNLRPDLERECRKKVLEMGQIPVAVKGDNRKRYEVLVRDCMFSYVGNGTLRPITCTSLLRTISKE